MTPETAAEAARMLRALVDATRPHEGADRRTARRIEGAAAALTAVAETETGEQR